jgi:hypothetical protein
MPCFHFRAVTAGERWQHHDFTEAMVASRGRLCNRGDVSGREG